jgi:hypothetical protein
LCETLLYKKAVHKMLVKLTPILPSWPPLHLESGRRVVVVPAAFGVLTRNGRAGQSGVVPVHRRQTLPDERHLA